MSITAFLHKNKIPISMLLMIGGLALFVLSIFAMMFHDGDGGITSLANDLLGAWAYWVLIMALAMIITGIYYIYSYRKMLKEFKDLIRENSKAKFIKKADRIEELAWRLHPKYEKIVLDKKKDFKIK